LYQVVNIFFGITGGYADKNDKPLTYPAYLFTGNADAALVTRCNSAFIYFFFFWLPGQHSNAMELLRQISLK